MSRTSRTLNAREKFVEYLSRGYSITKAAKESGVGRQTTYDWRKKDAEYDARCEDAIEQGADKLEDAAYARALESSDKLMELLLKAKRPEKYRERQDVNVKHQGETVVTIDLIPYEELGLKKPDDGDNKPQTPL